MTAHLDSGPTPPPRSDVSRIGAAEPVPQPAAAGGPTSYEQLDDHELLRLHVAGNPDSFGFLVKRHRDRMWAVAIRTLGEPEEAADALQEAYISAFRRADSFRGDAKVTTWLHRIVVNACLDRIRRRQSGRADPLPEDEDRAAELAGPPGSDPAERRAQAGRRRHQADHRRPAQAALVLVDMEGYSIEEAAAILGCAPGTVKSRCARGRARLLPLLRHWQTTRAGSDVPEKSAAETVGTE